MSDWPLDLPIQGVVYKVKNQRKLKNLCSFQVVKQIVGRKLERWVSQGVMRDSNRKSTGHANTGNSPSRLPKLTEAPVMSARQVPGDV